MNSYIYSLLIISVVGGIINSYTSSFGKTKKYVEYFIGLLIVITLISPIINVINNFSMFENNINDFVENLINEQELGNTNEIIINSSSEAIINGIKKDLVNKFNFDDKDLIIDLELDKNSIESIKIIKINVILTGKASWSDVDTVKEYLEKIIGGDIYVTRK